MHSSGGTSSKSRAFGSAQLTDASTKRKRGVFQKDLQHMMYGFGDDPNPLPETVALVEDIAVEYITDMVHKAQDVASKRGKLLTEDFLFLIRKTHLQFGNFITHLIAMVLEIQYIEHLPILCFGMTLFIHQPRTSSKTLFCLSLGTLDMPKLHRCTELLSMNEELKQARKAFEVDEEKLATTD